jgi:alginate O-acetyltransferase complex protein AlgI
MLFVELRFFLFFFVVLVLYWRLRDAWWRKLFLLIASYVFYAAWDWRFLGLIWWSTVMDYFVGRALARMGPSRWRVRLLTCSIVVNLGFLFAFKYFNFFVSSFTHWTVQMVLPVGISFYTFETISYTVDVYRGERPAKSLLDFALFLAFFPHLLIGPILRPREFLPQLDQPRRLEEVDVRTALMQILVGFVKKSCIGDNLSLYVDAFFSDPARYGAHGSWMGALFWALQVYYDFSGYADMAIGCAALLGYKLVPNFDYPYLSSSVTEFWRRWHMSLSRFLRDYLYVPMGGNRGSRLFVARNLMITMVLCGLWHGARWQCILWGGIHGVALIVERFTPIRPARWARTPLTFLFCAVALVLFRANSFSDAWITWQALIGHAQGEDFGPAHGLLIVAALAIVHVVLRRRPFETWWRTQPSWRFGALYGLSWGMVLPFVQLGYRPFFYFQF